MGSFGGLAREAEGTTSSSARCRDVALITCRGAIIGRAHSAVHSNKRDCALPMPKEESPRSLMVNRFVASSEGGLSNLETRTTIY
jgi:hypothetical protein